MRALPFLHARVLAVVLVGGAGCVQGGDVRPTIHAEGRDVVLESSQSLRGLLVELDGVAPEELSLGADATRMTLFRAGPIEGGSRVIVTDTRRLHLPVRGAVLHVEGDAPIRIRRAEGADDTGTPTPIEVRE